MSFLHGAPQSAVFANSNVSIESYPQRIVDNYSFPLQLSPVAVWAQPEQKYPTIYQWLKSSPQFSIWADMVDKAKMAPLLNDSSVKITFFAVPNEAFKSTAPALREEMSMLDSQAIIGYNTLKYALTAADMYSKQIFVDTYFPHRKMYIDGSTNTIRIGMRHHRQTTFPNVTYHPRIVNPDYLASNGIVHIVNIPSIPEVKHR